MPDKLLADQASSDPALERLEIALLARLNTSAANSTADELASELERYAPVGLDAAIWRERVTACLQGLDDRQLAGPDRRAARADELKRRTGAHAVRRWQDWSERVLPALALGVRADDAKAHKRLKKRDDWAAAIVARGLGIWSKGAPPSAPALCDAVIWRSLGLSSTPKRCPAELRAYYLQGHLEIDTGPPDRMLRQIAAAWIGAPRIELKAFHAALIRLWLGGAEIAPGARARGSTTIDRAAADPIAAGAPVGAEADEASLIEAVRDAARGARDGVFGDRKVFISSVWSALRALPPWSGLDLEAFKARLVVAHRRRELVLARADLVAAMDPALVASSETRTDGATFHFIVREPVQ